ncbi:hypothetical protein [Nocardia anaemiae]|uniref:hypothetical protein n=1 Tax=Nocardia anaemiae TaxID=263910 RepID=UPI0012F4A2B8|nr:hypothetical protein [Nocardia anaemiae]
MESLIFDDSTTQAITIHNDNATQDRAVTAAGAELTHLRPDPHYARVRNLRIANDISAMALPRAAQAAAVVFTATGLRAIGLAGSSEPAAIATAALHSNSHARQHFSRHRQSCSGKGGGLCASRFTPSEPTGQDTLSPLSR